MNATNSPGDCQCDACTKKAGIFVTIREMELTLYSYVARLLFFLALTWAIGGHGWSGVVYALVLTCLK